MYRSLSILGVCKKALLDPEARVLAIWGVLAFVVGYGADTFSGILPVAFLGDIPAMKEWIGKTKYGGEAAIVLSFMWLSLPMAALAQTIAMKRHRYLPITLKKLTAFFIFCLMIYFALIRGVGTNIEDYKPYGFLHRMYYGSMLGMIFIIWCLFSMTVFTVGMLLNWLLGISGKRR